MREGYLGAYFGGEVGDALIEAFDIRQSNARKTCRDDAAPEDRYKKCIK